MGKPLKILELAKKMIFYQVKSRYWKTKEQPVPVRLGLASLAFAAVKKCLKNYHTAIN